MFKDLALAWKLWAMWREVKDMDTKAIIKLLICAVLAGGTAAGGAYVADQPIVWSSIASTVIASVVAFLQKSPIAPKA